MQFVEQSLLGEFIFIVNCLPLGSPLTSPLSSQSLRPHSHSFVSPPHLLVSAPAAAPAQEAPLSMGDPTSPS